jgi:hypothetical protein
MNPILYSVAGTLALAVLAYYMHVSVGPPMAYVAFAAVVLAFWHTVDRLRSTLLAS